MFYDVKSEFDCSSKKDQVILKIELMAEIDGEILIEREKRKVVLNEEIKKRHVNPVLPQAMSQLCAKFLHLSESINIKTAFVQGDHGLKVEFYLIVSSASLEVSRMEKLPSACSHFLDCVYGQQELNAGPSLDSIEDVEMLEIEKSASEFLEQHGGKELIPPSEIKIGDKTIRCAKGKVLTVEVAVVQTELTVKARFDGRWYSNRIAYFLGSKGKEWKVYYDQDEFHERFKILEGGVDEILEVKMKKIKSTSKETFHLLDFKVCTEEDLAILTNFE